MEFQNIYNEMVAPFLLRHPVHRQSEFTQDVVGHANRVWHTRKYKAHTPVTYQSKNTQDIFINFLG